MRVGVIGGIILLILTIVFSVIAIQNNKIAKTIAIKQFELDKKEKNETTDNFDTKFKKELDEFDKKFKSF